MTLAIFNDAFDTIADAPGGIARLRALILQLAVQGRLVAQDAADEPASVLLERLRYEKKQLAVVRRYRSDDSEAFGSVQNGLFSLPFNWSWMHLGEIALIQGGKRLPAGGAFTDSPTEYIYVQVTNMKNGTIIRENIKYIDHNTQKAIARYTIDKEDLYITIAGTIGQVGEVPNFFDGMNLTENAAKIVFRDLEKRYLLLALRSETLQAQFRDKTNQQAQPKLALKRIADALIPLPPLAEQRRIVERVDQLMAHCDALEAQQARQGDERRRLLATLIDGLLAAPDADAVEAAWARLRDSFDLLLDAPESVAPLRQAVLQLAVQGRLVAQDAADEPASALLERVRVEKARLVKEGKVKKVEPFLEVVSEQPFKVPEGWEWVRLASLIVFGPTNGISPKAVEEPTDIKSLTLTATTSGKFDGRHFKYIDAQIAFESNLWLENGDILVQRGNTIEYVGVAAVYRGSQHQYIYPDLMIKIRSSSEVDVAYLHTVMNSQPMRDYLRSRATGTSGSMPKINHSTLMSLPTPLPPLAEQRRIVERVDELMTLCDALESQLREERAAAGRLAEALCAAVAAGEPSHTGGSSDPPARRQPANVIAPVEHERALASATNGAVYPTSGSLTQTALDLDARPADGNDLDAV